MCEVGNILGWISLLELFILCLETIDRTGLAVNSMAIKFVCLTQTLRRVINVKQETKNYSLTSALQNLSILFIKQRIFRADIVGVYVIENAGRVLHILGIHDPQLQAA